MKQIALNIIEKAFAGKTDKAGKPYVGHLKRVADYSAYYTSDEHERVEVIALLHDLLEDCPEWTVAHLSAIFKDVLIIDAIDRLTRKPEIRSYEQYIQNIKNNRFAKAVKLADLQDNMDLTRLPILTEKDIERTKKYHKAYIELRGKDGTTF